MTQNRNITLDELEAIAQLLYENQSREAYERFPALVTQLAQIATQMKEPTVQLAYIQALQKALEAMEQKNDLLLADILHYEVADGILRI